MSAAPDPVRPRLLLLGAGHAHLTAIGPLAAACAGRVQLTMLAPRRLLAYSGMMPGWIAGQYALDQCLVDVGAVCARAGVEWIEDEAVALAPGGRGVIGRRGPHDASLLSIDVGAAPARPRVDDGSVPVIGVKPFETFTAGWQAWLDAVERGEHPPTLLIAGGGAAAVEVAFAAAHRLRGRPGAAVTLATGGRSLSGMAPLAVRWCLAGLRRAGVRVVHRRLAGIVDGQVRLEAAPGRAHEAAGDPLTAALVILATGPRPLPWLAECARAEGLPTDDAGFLVVDPALRVPGHPWLFAAGDCATIRPDPVPRAGVHALRQGPVLAASLVSALDAAARRAHGGSGSAGANAPSSGAGGGGGGGEVSGSGEGAGYRVRRPVLALLNRADGTAVASFGPLAAAGAWVWRWKDRIDRRFIERFR